jgi:hypothetical protein
MTPVAAPRRPQSLLRRSGAVAVLSLALGIFGCDRTAELEAALDGHRADWARGIAALRMRHSATMGQFNSHPTPPTDSGSYARHARARAIVLGTNQSLSDLDNAAIQAAQRVEAAIRRDTEAAERALEEGNANIRRAIARMAERSATTERQIAALETGAMALESKGE